MNTPVDLRRIYIESMRADFSDFIKLLKNPPESIGLSNEEFQNMIFSSYRELYKSELLKIYALMEEEEREGIVVMITAEDGKKKKESYLNKLNRIQGEVAQRAAEGLYEAMHIPDEYRIIFINSITYCLMCRFKNIPDPINHQVTKGITEGVEEDKILEEVET